MSTPAWQEVTKYPHATFSWVELHTTDADGGKKFYTELFGWTYQDEPSVDGGYYTMFSLHGKYVAELYGGNPDVLAKRIPPNWLSFISVDNLDATTEQVQAAGGTVLMSPFDVMDSGRTSVIQDPTGAVFSLWEARNHIGAGYVNMPGALIWNELLTNDIAAAAGFYTKLLGWTAQVSTAEPASYTTFENGERGAAGMLPITKEMGDIPPHWSIYFAVEDCDASTDKAQALGGQVLREPMDLSTGRLAVLRDPQGAAFNIIAATYVDPPPQG
jgi:uncharacterized protein